MKPGTKFDPLNAIEADVCFDLFCSLACTLANLVGAGIVILKPRAPEMLGALNWREEDVLSLLPSLPAEFPAGKEFSCDLKDGRVWSLPLWEKTRRPIGALLLKVAEVSSLQASHDALTILARQISTHLEALCEAKGLEAKMQEHDRTNAVLTVAARRFEKMFHGLPIGCFTFDDQGTVIETNAEFERIFQTCGSNVFMQPVDAVLPNYDGPPMADVFEWGSVLNQEVRVDLPDGESRTVLFNAFPVTSGETGSLGVAACVDITERKLMEDQLSEANAKLRETSTRDGLTGLKNHRAFQEHFSEALEGRHPLAILMLDVDNFKKYNDSFGHPAGDEVLKKVGELLTVSVRPDDFVARYGGEEFVVVLKPGTEPEAIVVANRINEAFRKFAWAHRPVTASIGIATTERFERKSKVLIQKADEALYQSKHAGRDRATVNAGEDALPKSA